MSIALDPPASRTPQPTAPGGPTREHAHPGWLALYAGLGLLFGIVLVKSEAVSWFRIQEMFRFQSVHMYGLLATALAVAVPSVQILKRWRPMALNGERIEIPAKPLERGVSHAVGGAIFGMGWALTGACPGPLYALFGSGIVVLGLAIVAAIAGAWAYACVQHRLPH